MNHSANGFRLIGVWGCWGSATWLEAEDAAERGGDENPAYFSLMLCAAFDQRPDEPTSTTALAAQEYRLTTLDGRHLLADYAVLDREQWDTLGRETQFDRGVQDDDVASRDLITFDSRAAAKSALARLGATVQTLRTEVNVRSAFGATPAAVPTVSTTPANRCFDKMTPTSLMMLS